MSLNLPKKTDCKVSDASEIEKQLNLIVAYQPKAISTYQLYEEIDAWLGPWGEDGYPIGYGKKYNIAFNSDPYLNSIDNPISQRWVRNTTVNLQIALINYIVSMVRSGKFAAINEKSLRAAAFAAHPKAYLDAGLRDVAREEVGSIFRIFLIPISEFNPSNPSFGATITQVRDVITDPGILSWISDLSSGVMKWPINELAKMLGPYFSYLEWEIKKLYGYPGNFY